MNVKPLNPMRDRRFWFAAAAIAAFAALQFSGLRNYLSLVTIMTYRQDLTAFVSDNSFLTGFTYVLVYIVAVAFSLPGAAVLTLAGGFLFGTVKGTLFTVIGATAGATAIFLFARVIFGSDALARLGPQAKSLAESVQKNAASYLLVLRLAPLFPFFLVNLIPAFVGVRTWALSE